MRLHRAEILSVEEKYILLETFNVTAQEVSEATVNELFEMQVAQTPEATAIVQDERSFTYRELNEQANRLAHYLIARTRRSGITGRNRAGAFAGDGGGDSCGMEIRSSLPAAGSGVSVGETRAHAGRCAAATSDHGLKTTRKVTTELLHRFHLP